MEFKFFRNHWKIKALKIEFFKAFFICTQFALKFWLNMGYYISI